MIEENQHVIIQRKSYTKLQKIPSLDGNNKDRLMYLSGKQTVDLTSCIGKPFGLFKMHKCEKNPKHKILEPAEYTVEVEDILKDKSSGEDNKSILDDGNAQQLSKDDIESLKDQGLTGSEILSKLVENSKTFEHRTEFSQEKYVAKKEEKYTEFVEILQPTIRLLSHHFYQQNPLRFLNLRQDSLAQILTAANVRSGSNYLVFDLGSQSLLLASVLERLSGNGKLVQVLPSLGQNQKAALQAMNFTPEQLKPLSVVTLDDIKRSLSPSEPPEIVLTESQEGDENSKKRKLDSSADAQPGKRPRRELATDVVELIKGKEFDGLLIACRQPSNLIDLISLLRPSKNFAIFCPFIEPLMEMYVSIKSKGNAVALRLCESWFRHYQILPERSHPEINMSGGGGYILSGITVLNE